MHVRMNSPCIVPPASHYSFIFIQSSMIPFLADSSLSNCHCCNIASFSSVPGKSGWGKLWRTYRAQLCQPDISHCVTTGDIKSFLDSKGVRYQSYELPSQMEITECFTEGDEKGELLLDFLTEVLDFSNTASPELRAGVLEMLRHPDCSVESNGKVIFNNNLEAIVLDQLS